MECRQGQGARSRRPSAQSHHRRTQPNREAAGVAPNEQASAPLHRSACSLLRRRPVQPNASYHSLSFCERLSARAAVPSRRPHPRERHAASACSGPDPAECPLRSEVRGSASPRPRHLPAQQHLQPDRAGAARARALSGGGARGQTLGRPQENRGIWPRSEVCRELRHGPERCAQPGCRRRVGRRLEVDLAVRLEPVPHGADVDPADTRA
mmetsp:Transcript_9675/g.28825  ORF Transcript_9675/g.28825 Transcript_9675/m.28825 type:complete len:210 (-) Transcript_9675:1049-1678(-)